jgi:acyl-CoA thioester hydrolase
MEIPIRWGDMDALGHVNNTLYFRYMESIRIAWFRSLGVTPSGSSEGWVLIDTACTFERQFEYPGTVLASLHVAAIGRSSVDNWVEMARSDAPATLCAYGSARMVWTDRVAQRSRPIPDDLRAALQRPWRGGVDAN